MHNTWKLLLSAALLISTLFLSSCDNDEAIVTPHIPDGALVSSTIEMDKATFTVGEEISCKSSIKTDGTIDSSQVDYNWTIKQDGEVITLSDNKDLNSFIPSKAGSYQFDLEASYDGTTVKTTIIIIIIEKQIIIDDGDTGDFTTVQKNLPGYYVGTVTTPWVAPYPVAFIINENGSYSAYNSESDYTPALYYGTDKDGPEKKITLLDITASGGVTGEIIILFDGTGTNTDDIKKLHFDSNYQNLSFEMWHHQTYGPVTVELQRVTEDKIPPRPLATPQIHAEGSMLDIMWPSTYKDSVVVTISSNDEYKIEYQHTPATEESLNEIGLGNPISLWDETAETKEYTKPVTFKGPTEETILLVRATKDNQKSGIATFHYQVQ